MTIELVQVRRQLRTAQLVDQHAGKLIEQMKKLLDEAGIVAGTNQMTSAQMSGLLAVAGETNCVPVVVSYIQYQIGRDDKHRHWARDGFGEKLVQQFVSLRAQAEGLLGRVASEDTSLVLQGTALSEEIERVWMELVRLYLGHMRRQFVYLRALQPRPRRGERP